MCQCRVRTANGISSQGDTPGDAGWLCSNLSEQFGGTGAKKPDAMVFPSAPNLDHSQVRVLASNPGVHPNLVWTVWLTDWPFDYHQNGKGYGREVFEVMTC